MSDLDGAIRTGVMGRARDYLANHPNLPPDDYAKIVNLDQAGTFGSGGSGVTDHGDLTGLTDDDHGQYHTDARGDAKYYTKTQVNTIQSDLQGEIDADVYTHAQLANVHHIAFEAADCDTKVTTHTNIVNAHNAVSDAAYSASWDGDATHAASKNAIYDKIETIQGGSAPDPITGAQTITDDFIVGMTETGEVGLLGWSFTNGSMVATTNEQNHPGITTRRSGTTAAQVASLWTNASNTTLCFRYDEWAEFTVILACVTTGTDFAVRAGIAASAAVDNPANGAYFERLAADTAWWRVTRASGVQTRETTGVSISTAWRKLTLKKNGATVEFYMDGALNGTHTTNIPAAATGLIPFVQVIPSTTTARDVKLDLIQFKLTGVTR